MLKSAFYEIDITPPLGCHIPGYFSERLATDVKERLYAKSVVINNGTDTIAIVSIDACYMPVDIHDRVVKRIEEFTGISPSNILLCATHSHTGAPISADKDNERRDIDYVNILCRQMADSATLANKRLSDTRIKFGIGEVSDISFNRNYIMKNGSVRTNPGRQNPDIVEPYAGIDPELPVLFFDDEKGNPKGAIVSFACHEDCVDGTKYSADFSGILSKELKRIYGETFVTVFMAGTCGNINHFDVSTSGDAPDHYIKMGKIITGEALKTISKAIPIEGEMVSSRKEYLKIKKRVLDPKIIEDAENTVATVKEVVGVKIATDSDPDQYKLAMAKKLLNLYKVEPDKEYLVPVQVIRIGDFAIYGFANEVFVQFGLYIKENSPFKNKIVASICNASLGYTPIKELYLPDVYESKPGSSYLDPEAGYIMSEKLLELGNELYNL